MGWENALIAAALVLTPPAEVPADVATVQELQERLVEVHTAADSCMASLQEGRPAPECAAYRQIADLWLRRHHTLLDWCQVELAVAIQRDPAATTSAVASDCAADFPVDPVRIDQVFAARERFGDVAW